ncbi:hypothetical protein GCM10009682_63380 [Luedemannella flava]|uniref:Fibronectin type-III domain-containing protein n=1 Tax=Luedemannella flava TaxID=349316 RepID=A0ABN2MWP8_9ACTN
MLLRARTLLVLLVAAAVTAATGPATAWAAPRDVHPPTRPGTPVVTSLEPDAVGLAWAPSRDDRGVVAYDVYQKPGRLVGTTAGTGFTVGGLSPATAYAFHVVARDTRNASAPSRPVAVTTPARDSDPPTVPGTPTLTGVTAISFSVAWAPSTDVSGFLYLVHIYDAAGNPVGRPETANTAITVNYLTPDTVYMVRISARDRWDNYSALSAPLTLRTLPDPGGPICRAVETSQGASSSLVSLSITNLSTTYWTAWTLEWDFAGDQQIAPSQASFFAQTGRHVVAHVSTPISSGAGPVMPGGRWDTMVLLTGAAGATPVLANVAVNGQACVR